jgi:hypothetical protein
VSLEAARQKLLVDLADQGRSNDTAAVESIKKQAQVLENEFAKLIGEVEADKTVNLGAIRAELKKAGEVAVEGCQVPEKLNIKVRTNKGLKTERVTYPSREANLTANATPRRDRARSAQPSLWVGPCHLWGRSRCARRRRSTACRA